MLIELVKSNPLVHKLICVLLILMVGVRVGFIVILIPVLVAVKGAAQLALLVKITSTIAPLTKLVVVYVLDAEFCTDIPFILKL